MPSVVDDWIFTSIMDVVGTLHLRHSPGSWSSLLAIWLPQQSLLLQVATLIHALPLPQSNRVA